MTDHCGGQKRQGDGNCRRPAGWGTSHPGIGHCKLHGGSTPSHQTAAQEEQARALAQTLGVPIVHDPKDGILAAIHWSWGHVVFYRAQVQRLDADALIWGITGHKSGYDGDGDVDVTDESAAAHMWLKLYDAERDRHAKLCIEAVKIGLDERRVRLEEAKAELLADNLRWLMGELQTRLDLNEAGQAALSDVVREMLQRMAAQEQEPARR